MPEACSLQAPGGAPGLGAPGGKGSPSPPASSPTRSPEREGREWAPHTANISPQVRVTTTAAVKKATALSRACGRGDRACMHGGVIPWPGIAQKNSSALPPRRSPGWPTGLAACQTARRKRPWPAPRLPPAWLLCNLSDGVRGFQKNSKCESPGKACALGGPVPGNELPLPARCMGWGPPPPRPTGSDRLPGASSLPGGGMPTSSYS